MNAHQSIRIYSIEGNIGAGKSTILEHLKKDIEADESLSKKIRFLKEPVDLWDKIRDTNGETILSLFYKDPKKWAFQFQIMAFSTRIQILEELIAEAPECEIIICERSLEADRNIFASMLHADGLIDDISYKIYESFVVNSFHRFPLNGVVYMRVEPEVAHERIQKRARDGEGGIGLDYLTKCGEYHDAWLRKHEVFSTDVRKHEVFSTEGKSTEGKSTEVRPKLEILEIDANNDIKKDYGQDWINQIKNFIIPTEKSICLFE
jgi:deoxyadenosine/deoxycytidine kinase